MGTARLRGEGADCAQFWRYLHQQLLQQRPVAFVSAPGRDRQTVCLGRGGGRAAGARRPDQEGADRSEEHTSELQSRPHLVCRLLLEKKKKKEKQPASTLA